MPRPKRPARRHTFKKWQSNHLYHEKLLKSQSYKNRKYIGPKTPRGQCIIVRRVRFRNKFWPIGPKRISPQQIAFINKHGWLPINDKQSKNQVDLTHICGRGRCINLENRHIVIGDHKRNMAQIKHHNKCDDLYAEQNSNRRKRSKRNGRKWKMRSSTKKKGKPICIECPTDICDCSTHKGRDKGCFKNFD